MGISKPGWFGGVAVALAGLSAFAWLASTVTSGAADAFDNGVRGEIHSRAFPALTYAMRGFTDLGEAVFLIALGALIVWRLLAANRKVEAAFFAAAAVGAEAFDQGLKYWFHRQRPTAYFGPQPLGYSFPSGHAFVSCCFYLAAAEIFIEEQSSRRRRVAARVAAVLLTGLIGLSRVYLGVHYLTDVLAGYAAAVAWLAIIASIHRIRRRVPAPTSIPAATTAPSPGPK